MPKKGYKQTEQHKENAGKALRGKKRPDMLGDKNPAKRPEQRERMRLHPSKIRGVKNRVKGWKRPDVSARNKIDAPMKLLENRKKQSLKMSGESNPSKRPEVIEKIRKSKDRHHIYLKEGPTIILSKKQHRNMHYRTYDYILEKFGKEGVDQYIDWFFKKYGD
jgi:hypothetical protein